MINYSEKSLIYRHREDSIYYADSKIDQHRYILKFLSQNMKNKGAIHSSKESILMRQLNHDNIVFMKESFYHVENGTQYEVLVFQYCSGGDLSKTIENQQCDFIRRIQLFLGIVQGLQYLQTQNIIHRDIKPENIMISRGIAKIGDFGIALSLNQNATTLGKKMGTLWYMSPQAYQSQMYGLQSDIWSLGIVLIELVLNQRLVNLLYGQKAPFQRQNFPSKDLLQKIKSEKLRKIIKKMLMRKADKRIKLSEISQKITKLHKTLLKDCTYKEVKLHLPLIIEDEDESQSIKSNQERRVDPRKKGIKKYKYKMKTTQNKSIYVTYDDHNQTLKLQYQKQQSILYQYRKLPKQFKEIFINLTSLNAFLMTKNGKVTYQSNGYLSFDCKVRQMYEYQQNQDNTISNVDKSQVSQISQINDKSLQISENNKAQSVIQQQDSSFSYHDITSPQQIQLPKYQPKEANVSSTHQNARQQSLNILSANPETSTSMRIHIPQYEEDIANSNRDEESNVDSSDIGTSKQPSQKSSTLSKKNKKKVNQDFIRPTIPQQQYEIKEQPQIPPTIIHTKTMKDVPGNTQHPLEYSRQNNEMIPTNQQPNSYGQKLPPNFDYNDHPRDQMDKIKSQTHSLQSQILILQKIEGPERRLLADHYVRLGMLYKSQLNHENAKENLRKGVEKYLQFKMYYSDDCANAILSVGDLFNEEGNFTEALKQYGQSLQIKKKIDSNDYITLSLLYNAIGEVYMRFQNRDQWYFAIECFIQAIKRVKDYFGEEKKMKVSPAINLGVVYVNLNEYIEAISILEQALEIHSKYPTRKLFIILKSLIKAYYRLSNFEQAHKRMQSLINYVKVQGKGERAQLKKNIQEWFDIISESPSGQKEDYLKRLKEYLKESLSQFPQFSQ